MGLKSNPDESYESWVSRVEKYEMEIATKRIEKGENIEIVIAEMSRNIIKKLLHPVIKNIQNSAISKHKD